MAGYRVTYTLATQLANELVEAADEMTLAKTIARYGRVDLLCIDELHTDPQRRGRQLALFGITLVAALLLPGVATGIEPLVRSSLFGWLPNWWNTGLGSLAAMSESETILTLGLWLVGVVLAGPIVEELYFRGELLPRIPARPWVAAFVNAALFAAYHLWQPYAVLTVFLFALPLAIARARYGATPATCAAVHCLVNLGVFIALVVGVITR